MLLLLAFGCDTPTDAPPTGTDTDCGPSQTWYPDADGDTFGDPEGAAFIGCDPPGGFVLDATDCDDAAAGVYPGATEACDGLDQDCDGRPDVELALWYADADGDGFGDMASGVETCDPPEGAITEGGDCNDADAAVHPGADEGCDGDDDDCDGVADLGELGIWHSDVDGDGYGSAYDGVESCSAPEAGYTQIGGDCQPSDATTYPGAGESCNDTTTIVTATSTRTSRRTAMASAATHVKTVTIVTTHGPMCTRTLRTTARTESTRTAAARTARVASMRSWICPQWMCSMARRATTPAAN